MSISRYFNLTIPQGQAQSQEHLTSEDGYRGPMTLTFISPDALPETVNIMICGPSKHYVIQQSNGQDIVLNAARALTVMIQTSHGFKLQAGGSVAQDRVFEVIWNVTNDRG